MIVIEGSDCTGKTTLARYLVELLNARGQPHVYRHLGKLADSFDQYWDYLPLMHRHSVQDRLYMSRVAYGRAAHNQRVMSPLEYRMLDAYAQQFGTVHVVLTAESSLIEHRCAEERSDTTHPGLYDASTILRVNDVYRELASDHGYSVDLYYHFTPEDPYARRHADAILTFYEQRQRALDEILARRR